MPNGQVDTVRVARSQVDGGKRWLKTVESHGVKKLIPALREALQPADPVPTFCAGPEVPRYIVEFRSGDEVVERVLVIDRIVQHNDAWFLPANRELPKLLAQIMGKRPAREKVEDLQEFIKTICCEL